MPRGVPNKKIETANANLPSERDIEYKLLFLQSIRDIIPTAKLYSDNRLTEKIEKMGKDKTMDSSLEFFSYLEAGAGSDLTKNEKLALANQLLKCLKKYINSIGVPFTVKVLVDHLSMIDHAVGLCYPGYYESKLLKYIIRPTNKQVA